jgi:hypothetical protein
MTRLFVEIDVDLVEKKFHISLHKVFHKSADFCSLAWQQKSEKQVGQFIELRSEDFLHIQI